MKSVEPVVDQLLNSEDSSIRYKVKRYFLGRDPDSDEIKQLRSMIKESPRVQKILSERDRDGRIPFDPYTKWYGSHWVLLSWLTLAIRRVTKR